MYGLYVMYLCVRVSVCVCVSLSPSFSHSLCVYKDAFKPLHVPTEIHQVMQHLVAAVSHTPSASAPTTDGGGSDIGDSVSGGAASSDMCADGKIMAKTELSISSDTRVSEKTITRLEIALDAVPFAV